MENRRWFNTVFLFCNGDKPKSEFAENLAIAYNPGICLLALPVIYLLQSMKAKPF